jgi:alpha-tubulin suppressor-like RCC1 family protein
MTVKISSVAHGNLHTLFLSREGIVYSVGSNDWSQLGLGNGRKHRIIPEMIKSSSRLPPICHVAAGFQYSMILSCSGNVYVFGKNTEKTGLNYSQSHHGRFGHAIHIPDLYNIKEIRASLGHSMALSFSGEVFVFGNSNTRYQMTDLVPNRATIKNPTKIPQIAFEYESIQSIASGDTFSLFLTKSGKLLGVGSNLVRIL